VKFKHLIATALGTAVLVGACSSGGATTAPATAGASSAPGAERWMGVQIQDPVLLRLELGVGRGLPGLVVGEADASLVEDPPESGWG